jgi:Fe-S-cluster containining protein
VLNAYLLRRGLGHFGAWKKLRRIRSKPANFDQWWSIRKYGRKMGILKVRTPTLEHQRYADIEPFLGPYGRLVGMVEAMAGRMGIDQRCGGQHDCCCRTPVCLSLVEAAHLLQCLNKRLPRSQRADAIERALAADRSEDALMRDLMPAGAICFFRREGYVCPLWVKGRCILYQDRPLQCRTFELDQVTELALWDDLHSELRRLSSELYSNLAGSSPAGPLPTFSISCVVSGHYVQEFFHMLKKG